MPRTAGRGKLMGWASGHIHTWAIWTSVQMMVNTKLEYQDRAVQIPFCAWICDCGAWRWRVSPEVLSHEGYVEI
jgi:hypothetical protein